MTTLTTNDHELRREVEQALLWDPAVDERRIGVAVVDGIATLQGEVASYGERWRAELAAQRVAGIRAVVNELVVKTPDKVSDTDIARKAVEALRNNAMVPDDKITVKVDNGYVTLDGEVEWDYQRRAADQAVRDLAGVRAVVNLIKLKPRARPEDLKRKIVETFQREAAVDANRITVVVNGSEVILRGTVRSWVERREAERAAWSAPGVTSVKNEIVVSLAA
jgi:osmotically-inducible protein OsmY